MLKIVEELKRSDAKRREKLLLRNQADNIAYFRETNAELAKFIEARGTGPYGIRFTDTSVDVFERQSGRLFHPPGGLFSYMSDLGACHHTAWVDKLVVRHTYRGEGEHGRRTREFLESVYEEMPERLRARMDAGQVSLPRLADGRRFSGPVVFLGIFTGLHILYYLSRTVVRGVFLIEPDLDRFVLSCFFVNYRQLNQQLGRLMLHVGPNPPQIPIDALISHAPVTASTWVRLLPAYPDGQFDEIISRVGLRWRALHEVFVPMERELQNLANGLVNLRAERPMLHRAPELSPNSVLAVVASGPSLNANMDWLRANQERMIILASISCVRVLKENGIRVDFQCTLDTEIDPPLLDMLQLDRDVPLVAYYKIDPRIVDDFARPLLLHEDNKANAVRFRHSFTNTHPTTGNLMVALAAWCRPARLLLLGLDLGFRDPRRSHVRGGWHDESEGAGHDLETGRREHISVPANFPESEGDILTIAYYNSARFAVEAALAGAGSGCAVLNLADGARIEGAAPLRATGLELPAYPDKATDCRLITESFVGDHAALYEPFETLGRQLIEEMTEFVLHALELPKGFRWPEFSSAVDAAVGNAVAECIRQHRDVRLEVFGKFMQDMLGEWYRTLLLTETTEEIDALYRKGCEALRRQLSTLPWPDELDALINSDRPLHADVA